MNEDFNDGIKIAIARMESNPEEFLSPRLAASGVGYTLKPRERF